VIAKLVKRYEQIHNSHDVDMALSLYSEDIRFEVVGMVVKVGKDQVRDIEEWDVETNSHMTISNIEVQGNTASYRLAEGNDWFRLAGIELMYYEPCRIVFREGLITVIKCEATDESRRAAGEAWQPIMEWASRERSDELARLMPNGKFAYGAENARKWISLLQDWRDATQRTST
jgi:hypothetical protein